MTAGVAAGAAAGAAAQEQLAVPRGAERGDVTVVISTYNRAGFLGEAIQSILGQTCPPARVVIVADGCTDHTTQVVQSFGNAVELVQLSNGGKARALNFVLPSITTAYCWFFDDDDGAYPGALCALRESLDNAPDAAFAFGAWDLAFTEGALVEAAKKPVPYAHAAEPLDRQRWELYRECTVMMTGALLRTAAVRKVNGLDERLIRGQDYDLMVRLAAEAPFVFCGESVYAWRQHEARRGSESASHGAASRLRVWMKSSEPVGRHLRVALPIRAWVSEADGPLPSAAYREALVRRVWALAPKQSIPLTVADLFEAVAAEPAKPLSETELRLLTHALSHDFVSYRRVRGLFRLVFLPRSEVSASALTCLSKGLYWLAIAESARLSKAKLVSMAVLLRVAASCLGMVAKAAPALGRATKA